MKRFKTPVSNSATNQIVGNDIEDAIRHNIDTLRTTIRWDNDLKQTIRTEHAADEVFAEWIPSILGGKGGVEVIFRGRESTYTAWVDCPKDEWAERGTIKIR
jgi:hypothetical protein